MADAADIEKLARDQVNSFLDDNIQFYSVAEDLEFDKGIEDEATQHAVYERANAILLDIYRQFNKKEDDHG